MDSESWERSESLVFSFLKQFLSKELKSYKTVSSSLSLQNLKIIKIKGE